MFKENTGHPENKLLIYCNIIIKTHNRGIPSMLKTTCPLNLACSLRLVCELQQISITASLLIASYRYYVVWNRCRYGSNLKISCSAGCIVATYEANYGKIKLWCYKACFPVCVICLFLTCIKFNSIINCIIDQLLKVSSCVIVAFLNQ